MRVEPERLSDLAIGEPLRLAREVIGTGGAEQILSLVRHVRRLYTKVAPEQVVSRLEVVLATSTAEKLGHHCSDVGEDDLASMPLVEPITLLATEETLSVLNPDSIGGDTGWRSQCLLYEFEEGAECFVVRGERSPILNPAVASLSVFSIPTFGALASSLEHYAGAIARGYPDDPLVNVWADDKRWVLANHPEQYMRRSLALHLRVTLSEDILKISVRQEQNVDESHPCDIQIVWTIRPDVGWIEIKWLGRNINRTSDGLSQGYEATRAAEGARQLCGYLDDGSPYLLGHYIVGYLVVFDARRKNIDETTTDLSSVDRFHYKLRPPPIPLECRRREDFAGVFRVFLEALPGPLTGADWQQVWS